MKSSVLIRRAVIGLVLAAVALNGRLLAEAEDYARWYFSPGMGLYLTEGDEPVEDGFVLNLRFGYDFNEWWSFEGGLLLAPSLNEQFYPSRNGIPGNSCVDDRPGERFGSTWMATVYGDALFHFTRWERLDPYLAGGLGFVLYGDDALDNGTSRSTFVMRAGGGVMYHFNDSWAVRGDWRLLLTTDNTEFNTVADVGVVWTWGASVPPYILATDGPEVLEDETIPLDGTEDLMLFELKINFDYDKSIIKPIYFADLDTIVKVLMRHPETTALIEGHADRLRTSLPGYNRRLSERRAQAVRQYIASKGVSASRLRAVGYGFDRPKVAHNLQTGTPANRRVDVYIRGIDREVILKTLNQ